jgi:hypothetical protein
MKDASLTITHLYPEEMNLYGDLGNVICLQKRCKWRGIDIEIQTAGLGDSIDDINTDIYFFGGGQDNDQIKVFNDLVSTKKQKLTSDLEASKCMLAICGGYQLLGQYFLDSSGNKIEGIGFLPIETVAPGAELAQRAIGNLVTRVMPGTRLAKMPQNLDTLVGFENHSGRTRVIDKQRVTALGKVVVGEGDNEDGISDGVIYKNTIGSYMHGSVLPKNPHLADFLISQALQKKYGKSVILSELDDKEEIAAHNYMIKRYKV